MTSGTRDSNLLQLHLLEAVVVDAEVVRHLVDGGVPDLSDHLLVGGADGLDGALK